MNNLRVVPDPDAALEARIAEARERYSARPSQFNWERLKGLVRQRSAEQVAKMERARGLR